MNDQRNTSAEARAALESVNEMKLKMRLLGSWPLWLSVVVAACFGVNGAIRYYFGPGTSTLFAGGVGLACLGTAVTVYLLHFRSQGLVVRHGFRWLSGILINSAFKVGAISTHGMEVDRSGLEAMLYGTLEFLVILLVWFCGSGVMFIARSVSSRNHTRLQS